MNAASSAYPDIPPVAGDSAWSDCRLGTQPTPCMPDTDWPAGGEGRMGTALGEPFDAYRSTQTWLTRR
jgi:hypothetical protein